MISVCILTKNAQETIQATLDALKYFSNIVICDTGSTDLTIEIARKYTNVTVFEEIFSGFGKLRNALATKAKFDWILAIDSDEIITPKLVEEISHLDLDPQAVYEIPRHNFYNGKRILGCGWGLDKVLRLYNRNYHSFSSDDVHESIKTQKKISLKNPILHTPYRSTEDFLKKMQHYTNLFAKQYAGKRTSSFPKALFKALFCFFRSFFVRGGIFDGEEGFIISLYNSNTTFYKYLKLKEENFKMQNSQITF